MMKQIIQKTIILTKKLLKSVINDWNNRMCSIVEPQIPVFENRVLNVINIRRKRIWKKKLSH